MSTWAMFVWLAGGALVGYWLASLADWYGSRKRKP